MSELLLPAGSLDHIRFALAYGADAVYAGLPRYSLRVRNNDFSQEKVIREGIEYCHQRGKKFYLVCNIAPHNSKINTFIADLAPLLAFNPDALIMSDPGLIMMVQDAFPDVPIHLSVQINTVNYKAVEFWQQQGIERIILSRELSIEEIAEIRQQCPEMELEVFVHGALCIAYSGRCLLSGYLNKRDPNQGTCTNACRWDYKVSESQTDFVKVIDPQQDVLLEDKHKPGEFMTASEDEHGTYIMNSKDLKAIEYVHKLTHMGISSLKIEGRTKSLFYVARTAQAYRYAIDLAKKKQPLLPHVTRLLDGLANRGYTPGFLKRHQRPEQMQNYQAGYSNHSGFQYVGRVIKAEENNVLIEVKNRFSENDTLEMMTPQGNFLIQPKDMLSQHKKPIKVAKGSGISIWLKIESIQSLPQAAMCLVVRHD